MGVRVFGSPGGRGELAAGTDAAGRVAHVDLQHAAAQGLEDELLLLALDLCSAQCVPDG